MYCKNCNKPLKDGAKFCTSCGSKVEATSELNFQPEGGNNKKKLIFIISGIAAFFCIACIAGYFIYKSYSPKDVDKQKTAVVSKNNKQTEEKKVDNNQSAPVNIYDEAKDATKEEKSKVSPAVASEIDTMIGGYLDAFVSSTYSNNFSLISSYMKHDSAIYNTQKKLLDKYKEKGITVFQNYHDVLDVKKDGNLYTARVKESFDIYKTDGKSTKEYIAEYKIVKENNKFYMTDITTK